MVLLAVPPKLSREVSFTLLVSVPPPRVEGMGDGGPVKPASASCILRGSACS